MQQNKNILIINDMPGYGKVALAAMLPILSHMGHNIYNPPLPWCPTPWIMGSSPSWIPPTI